MPQIDESKLNKEIKDKYTVVSNALEVGFSNWFSFATIKKAMIDTMLPTLRKEIKVFNSVVRMYFVDMVNYLVFRKITPKIFFNYKSVFRDISLFVSKRMFGRFNFNISLTGSAFSTLPMIVFFSRIISSFSFIPRSISFSKFIHKLSIVSLVNLSNLYR